MDSYLQLVQELSGGVDIDPRDVPFEDEDIESSEDSEDNSECLDPEDYYLQDELLILLRELVGV